MRFNVWWHCPIHDRWEMDAENMRWEEALAHCAGIIAMTGRPVGIEKGEVDDMPVVRKHDVSTDR